MEPLDHFPVVRDLVVDLTDFMNKLKQVKPWIIREEERPTAAGEYLQTPEQLEAYKQFSMCINCMLCYAACPIYGLEPGFIGPAAIALAQRYNMDSRDEGGGGAPGDRVRARRHLAVHVRRRVHQGLPQARGSGRRHPAVQAHRRDPLGQVDATAVGRPMSAGPHYTLYHPRWYRRRISVWWWLHNRSYTVFVLREMTSVFVAIFAVVYLWQLRALARGPGRLCEIPGAAPDAAVSRPQYGVLRSSSSSTPSPGST